MVGLVINKDNIKYVIIKRNKTSWRYVRQFEGYESVEQFKYLGDVTKNNEVPTEIEARPAAGNIFQKVLTSSLVTRHLELLV